MTVHALLRARMAAVLAAAAAAALVPGVLTGAKQAAASTPHKVPVVTVHVSGKRVTLSTGSRLHAGKVIFRVLTRKGDRGLQIARLHKGYTFAEAAQDLSKAFSGDVQAVRRVDSHITFRGGAEATPTHPGRFATTLRAGRFVFVDQNSNAHKFVTVYGATPERALIRHRSSITAFTYGFGTSSKSIPATGWTRVADQSDQPHLVAFQHVKASTTNRMVRRFFKHGAHGRPSWGLPAHTSTGVMSPHYGETFHYSLPAGKYLIACYWPDDDTGMPHAFMGMWKLIWLK